MSDSVKETINNNATLNAPITDVEIEKCINRLRNNKAAGIDCVVN